MIRSIDHIVILVQELDQGIADFSALGFQVVRGGDHPGGSTHNALVVFADGAYLELIAFKQPNEQHRWWRAGQRGGEGIVDYALLPGAIAQDVADAHRRGLAIEAPVSGGRLRPDGVKLEWQTSHAASSDLPFLCGDITPRALRVPEGAVRQHPNGALGVAGITIAVSNLHASAIRYQALLGSDALAAEPRVVAGMGLRAAIIALGATRITLVSPLGDGGPAGAVLRDHLAQRGEGPFALALAVASGKQAQALSLQQTHGARLELVLPSDEAAPAPSV